MGGTEGRDYKGHKGSLGGDGYSTDGFIGT